jgi:hypothetical protein
MFAEKPEIGFVRTCDDSSGRATFMAPNPATPSPIDPARRLE